MCKRVVDCTGDADVAHLAGCRTQRLNKESMMGVTTVLNVSGVDCDKFTSYADRKASTYADWIKVWQQETDNKEDTLRSPVLMEEFEKAAQQGIIPESAELQSKNVSIGGTWSSLSRDTGEATNLNIIYMTQVDGTNVVELTKAEMEGRKQAMNAILGNSS